LPIVWTSLGFLTTGWTAPGVTPPAYPDLSLTGPRTILRSTDGTTWQALIDPALPAGDYLMGIAAAADRIVAVGTITSTATPRSAGLVLVDPGTLVPGTAP
jgi:hypothetical protein